MSINDRTQILERIQKLQALAERGGTVQEGLLAAQKIMELMDKYAVSSEELKSHAHVETPPVTIWAKIPEPVNHSTLLAVVLANGLKTFKVGLNKETGEIAFNALDEQTAKDAITLWSMLIILREANLKRAYRTAYKAGYKTQGFKTSYRNGFSAAILNLTKAHEESRTEETSTALVLVGAKLERYHKALTSGQTREVTTRKNDNPLGYVEGKRKGTEVGTQLLNRNTKRITG